MIVYGKYISEKDDINGKLCLLK